MNIDAALYALENINQSSYFSPNFLEAINVLCAAVKDAEPKDHVGLAGQVETIKSELESAEYRVNEAYTAISEAESAVDEVRAICENAADALQDIIETLMES